MRAILTAVVVGLATMAATADDKKSVVREVSVKDYEANFKEPGTVTKPTKIMTAEELAKALPGKDVAEKIGKQVDFSKEYLLLFRWSGSGGDQLTGSGETKATFAYQRGLTKDLRGHLHLFAVAMDAEWAFAT